MGVFGLKLLTDGFWYMGIFAPLFFRGPVFIKIAGAAVFFSWGVWMFLNWEKRTLWENGQERILFQAKVLAAVSAFEMMFLGMDAWGTLCGLWAFLFLAAGILFLRAARLPGGMSGAFLGSGLRDVLLVVLAAGLVTSDFVSGGAVFLLGRVYTLLILPILLGVLRLFLGVLTLLAPLFSGFLPEKANMEEFVSVQLDSPPMFEHMETGEPAAVWRIVGWFAAAAVIFGFLYLIYRRLSENGHGRKDGMEGELLRENAAAFEKRSKGRPSLFTEHDVRYFYRKFLILCKKKGLDTEKVFTTADVERMVGNYWKSEDTAEMRCLYLRARYGEKQEKEKDAADRKRAGELYRNMKKEEKQDMK